MIQKIFTFFFVILFISLFSYFNGEEFFEHAKLKDQITSDTHVTQGHIKKFGLNKIRKLEKTQFYITPDTLFLSQIVEKINSARDRVYIEVYLLTETRIKEALVQAHKRKVEVKVLLEHSPYKAVNLNKKHFKYLSDAGINVQWSQAKNYSLNHSKIMIIDEELVLSTGNFSYSTFAHNRDFFLVTRDIKILSLFSYIFLQDFGGTKSVIYDDSIVLSPDYSRDKFKILFSEAESHIQMYAQYLKDDSLLGVLEKQAQNGIKIEIILSKNGYYDYNKKYKKRLGDIMDVRAIKSRKKMHAKAILIDGKYLFIGSVNFSSHSFDRNREMGLLLTNENIVSHFTKVFYSDF